MIMSSLVETQQTAFEAQAQHLQDDAYTLAYYLLGNDNLAEAATEAVFSRVSAARAPHYDRLRVDVLRNVLSLCRHQSIPVSGRNNTSDIRGMLQTLGLEERSVAVLVDVLGFSYDETARVLDRPTKHVMRMLAQARLHLAA